MRTLAAVMLLALLAARAGGEDAHQQAVKSLAEAERAFARLSVETNQRDAFLAYFAEDAILFTPEPVRARENLEKQKPDNSFTLDWYPVLTGVSNAGDLGYSTGPWVLTDDKGGRYEGYFFSVWKRQADGKWRVALDIGARTPAVGGPLPWKAAAAPGYRAGAAPRKAEEDVELRKAEERFSAAVRAQGLEAAYRAVLNPGEARLHRKQRLPMTSAEAIREYLRNEEARGALSWEPMATLVAESADLGYTYGSYKVVGAASEQGYYTHVWKRDAQGEWKLVVDVKSAVPPATPPPSPQ